MAACQEISHIGDVGSELTRLRELMRIVYAAVTSNDRDLSEIKEGLVWVVSDIEDDVERIIAGLQNIEEAPS